MHKSCNLIGQTLLHAPPASGENTHKSYLLINGTGTDDSRHHPDLLTKQEAVGVQHHYHQCHHHKAYQRGQWGEGREGGRERDDREEVEKDREEGEAERGRGGEGEGGCNATIIIRKLASIWLKAETIILQGLYTLASPSPDKTIAAVIATGIDNRMNYRTVKRYFMVFVKIWQRITRALLRLWLAIQHNTVYNGGKLHTNGRR